MLLSGASPVPLLAAVGAATSRIEIGTAVIDIRYENPLYMAEDAGHRSGQACRVRPHAAEPDALIGELKRDEAITEADTLRRTVPNQLGVDRNAPVIEAMLTHIAPALA